MASHCRTSENKRILWDLSGPEEWNPVPDFYLYVQKIYFTTFTEHANTSQRFTELMKIKIFKIPETSSCEFLKFLELLP